MLTARIAVRALRNAELFKYDHFRQAALAIAMGMLIQGIIQIPVWSAFVEFRETLAAWLTILDHRDETRYLDWLVHV